MRSDHSETRRLTFHADRRGMWRVTWTLGCAFLLVAWLMQRDDAAAWPAFAAVAGLLLAIGVSALFTRSRPLVGVGPDGLCVFAGDVGLRERGGPDEFTIPWSAIASVGFEPRRAARDRGDEHPITVLALCFRLRESAPRPDGDRGFDERVVGRERETAVGEHFRWRPTERTLELVGHPSGGFSSLTAAIAAAEPRLGDASAGRRVGLGGSLAYAVYDAGVAAAVAATLVLWMAGRMDMVVDLARAAVAWGGSLAP
jgi:hypothetical protein